MRGYSLSRSDFLELLYRKYFPMEEIENGCIWLGAKDTDYQLCEGDIDTLPDLSEQDTIRYEYNQWAYTWSQVSCTIFAAAWMLSDLKNYKFSEAELKEMDEMSYERGRIRGQWWYVQDAVKCVADRWNNSECSKTHWKVAYFRIAKWNDTVIQWALDKLYTLDTNYKGNAEYNKDYKADWVLDGTEFWISTYWHAVGIISNNWKRSVKDNYYWRKRNIYELKNKISDIKCYGLYLYIYTNVNDLAEVKRLNEIKTECLNCIASLQKLYHLVNDTNFQGILHYTADKMRAKIQDCDSELKKYL